MKRFRLILPWALAAVTLLALSPLQQTAPEFIRSFFTYPSALVASLFLGAPLVDDPREGFVILHRLGAVGIISACSGFSFWMITLSLSLWRITRSRLRAAYLAAVIAAVPCTWIITIIINGIRISATVYVSKISAHLLPESFAPMTHLWTGILVFFPTLCAAHYFLYKRFNNENAD